MRQKKTSQDEFPRKETRHNPANSLELVCEVFQLEVRSDPAEQALEFLVPGFR